MITDTRVSDLCFYFYIQYYSIPKYHYYTVMLVLNCYS